MDYYERAGLREPLEALGFQLVGFGCTTCIGNSGPAAARGIRGGARGRPVGRRGSVGQPQLRGAHPPRRPAQLPGVSPAGGGVRAGRHDGRGPHHGAARHGRPTAMPSTCATSGRPRPRSSDAIEQAVTSEMFRDRYASVFEGDERWKSGAGTAERHLRVGPDVHLRAAPAVLRRLHRRAAAGPRHRRGPRARHPRRQRDDGPHLAGRVDPAELAGRHVPDRARGRPVGVQLLRGPARQPRGHDARHLRQRPPAQPARPGHRGRRHPLVPRRRGDEHLRRGHALPAPTASRSWCWRGASTGSGSSRDWAAKGPALLGVRAVIADELRAHPPFESHRHGDPALAVRRR